MRYRWLLIALPVLLAMAAGVAVYMFQPTEQHARRPNILLIVLDDFGYNDLGANGNPRTPTPNLDALAAQGTRYTRHYADATCSVARAALMTGRFPASHGLRPDHFGLSTGTPTIASMLSDAGYHTQHIGKWHIATATLEQSPSQLGFDDWFGFLHQQETSGPSNDGITFHMPTYLNPWLHDNQSPLKQYPGHLTNILTERAIGFLDQQKEQTNPWFLNLWHFAPHGPIQPSPEFRKKYPANEEGAYHALIDQLDSNIGLVMEALDRNGLSDNTLVIVLSDNGGTNHTTDNNYPYYGKKGQFYEGGLRTPLLMRWPGHIAANVVSNEIVSLYDIFPTIAQASSAVPPPHLIGRSLLDPERAHSPQLYWEYSDSQSHTYSILSSDGRWRFTEGTWVLPTLNDLLADSSGKDSVLEDHPEIVAKLKDDYLQWRKTARKVDVSYELVNNRGSAIIRSDDLQRSPGRGGFTFAIGVTPSSKAGRESQVIVEQSGRWRLETNAEQGLRLNILGKVIEGPTLPAGQCSELVISSHFKISTLQPKSSWSIIDIYLNGELVNSARTEQPPLVTWGYANPTYVGISANGEEPFLGELSRPIILNERIVPDDQSEMIGNGISDVPPTCPPIAAELQ